MPRTRSRDAEPEPEPQFITRAREAHGLEPGNRQPGRSVYLAGEALTALEEIAGGPDGDVIAALATAIASHRFLSAELRRGGKVLVERADGSFRLVVLPSMPPPYERELHISSVIATRAAMASEEPWPQR